MLELSFVPADVSSLDTIYENLSYCASLHQDDMDDEDMDGEGDYYEDDINDHDGLYADADIQGGYIPKSSSATAIGTSSSSGAQGEGEVEQVPAIDLQSGEWYTGNAETDAKFELSEHGQVMVQQWSQNQKQEVDSTTGTAGKRLRQEDEEASMMVDASEAGEDQEGQEYTEEQEQEARSKMWRAY